MSWGIVPSLSYAVYKMDLAKIDESDNKYEVIKQSIYYIFNLKSIKSTP